MRLIFYIISFFQVSWLRGRDTSVLSVGRVTFSSDQRFQVVEVPNSHLPTSSDWNLEVLNCLMYLEILYSYLRLAKILNHIAL